MWVPRALGGAELDPIESLQVIENVAYGDPSTGWVLMAAALAIGTGRHTSTTQRSRSCFRAAHAYR